MGCYFASYDVAMRICGDVRIRTLGSDWLDFHSASYAYLQSRIRKLDLELNTQRGQEATPENMGQTSERTKIGKSYNSNWFAKSYYRK